MLNSGNSKAVPLVWHLTAMDCAVPIGFGVLLFLIAPLRATLEFGVDEGYELMKAFLVSLGHPLYREIWNDHPPLHTEMVAALFRIFGPSAYVARLLSLSFATLLVGSLYKLVSYKSGRLAGLVAVGLLLSSAYFLQLSVSVMLEVPAMALATTSVLAWFKYTLSKKTYWLVLSGALFACALQIKFTAAIFLPALCVEYLISEVRNRNSSGGSEQRGMRKGAANALVWCGAVVIVSTLIILVFYRLDTIKIFFESHFSAGTNAASLQYAFRPGSFIDANLAQSVPVVMGVAVIAYTRRWDRLFPAGLLLTVLLVHLSHRPYWSYYALHFAIPMAWLGSIGIVEWFRSIWTSDALASWTGKLRAGLGWLIWAAVVSLVLTLAPADMWDEIQRIRNALPASEDPIVIAIKSHAAQTQWIFTDCRTCAFWAGIPVPPELAVIPSKRIWSGQISSATVLRCLERYGPEEVLIPLDWEEKFQLSGYIRKHYRLDPSKPEIRLYLRNRS